MSAQVGTITHKIGGVERAFGLLSVEDLVSLTHGAPSANGEILDIYALDKWSKHVFGCSHFLLAAARKVNPALTFEDVATWGSVLRRTQIASDLLTRSLVSGEEPDVDPKPPAGESPATGGSKPQ